MGRPKGIRIKKNCLVCNTEFEVIESRKHTAKFCKHKCSTDYNRGKPTWNSGKKYEDIYTEEQIKRIKSAQSLKGKNNPNYGKKHSKETKRKMRLNKIGFKPWNWVEKDRGEYEKYKTDVKRITNRQPLETLPNYEKRGVWGKDKYHLDHIFPIHEGFKRGIPADMIGDIRNLQFIPAEENVKKQDKVTDESYILFRKSSKG